MSNNDPQPNPVRQIMTKETVQSVVHDLRTPMTVIKGNLQLLLSGLMGQMTEEQFRLIQLSVLPLEDLILMTENLLQAATLDQSELTLKMEETDLDRLLEETINFYTPCFQQRGMHLYREGNTFGARIRVDGFWMRRVLGNLIWNAYKFTPDQGQVIIVVELGERGLEIIVQDNGRGIPPDKMGLIFERFTQALPCKDRKMGTGLGLWICKRVLELHGGTIHVESIEGHGSRFILRIPSSCII
jgi:signal transduction histidine kinase